VDVRKRSSASAFSVTTYQPTVSCSIAEPWITQFRGLATYTIPKVDVLVSAIVRFQTTATGFFTGGDASPASNGTSLTANYNLRNDCTAAPACAPGTPSVLGAQWTDVNGNPIAPRLPAGGLWVHHGSLIPNGRLYPEQPELSTWSPRSSGSAARELTSGSTSTTCSTPTREPR
jgi:hypothetical protein